MKYLYQGKEVEVIRIASGGVAQLSSGEWISTIFLVEVPESEKKAK